MNMFGRSDSDGIPDPPSCLVSVYADNEQKAAKLLSYAVPFERGFVSRRRDIYNSLPRNYRYYNNLYILCTHNTIDSLLTDTSRTVQQFGAPSKPTG